MLTKSMHTLFFYFSITQIVSLLKHRYNNHFKLKKLVNKNLKNGNINLGMHLKKFDIFNF